MTYRKQKNPTMPYFKGFAGFFGFFYFYFFMSFLVVNYNSCPQYLNVPFGVSIFKFEGNPIYYQA